MQLLPPIVLAEQPRVLPMADTSAAALTRWLLDGELSSAAKQPTSQALSNLLAQDPPLLFWVICRCAASEGESSRTVDDAGEWLAHQALKALHCGGPPSADDNLADEETWAQRVEMALQRSDLAAHLAAQENVALVREVRLLGLLYDAPDWAPDWFSAANTAIRNAPLPSWLTAPPQPVAGYVEQAAATLLDSRRGSGAVEVELGPFRRRAAEGRKRWLATLDTPIDWLPSLVDKLARLDQLQNQFAQVVETEKLEAMAEFAAGAGHEINNPLTVIAGRAQLFLREESDPERRRALALMNAQAMRVHEMIADMRLFARPPQPETKPTELTSLIDNVLSELRGQAQPQEIKLVRSGAESPIEAEVDPTQLTVALRAMCQNAMEAIGRDGHIEIALEATPKHVAIRVTDDGPGMTAEERRHAFDPYYSARQAGRGLGLGLSKAWRIVTNHRGHIDVETELGHGATFVITLPRHAEA